MQAHRISGVVMDIAAFKVSHSINNDATTLQDKSQHVSAGRWMKVQGKFKMQAHITSCVVMDVAAFKVSHSVVVDKDATALRASRARSSSIGAMERYMRGFDSEQNSRSPATTHHKY